MEILGYNLVEISQFLFATRNTAVACTNFNCTIHCSSIAFRNHNDTFRHKIKLVYSN